MTGPDSYAGFSPDELYRALLSAELDAVLSGGDRDVAVDLFDRLVDRRDRAVSRSTVAAALTEQRDYDLALIFVAAGNRGVAPRQVFAELALSLALEDVGGADDGDTAS